MPLLAFLGPLKCVCRTAFFMAFLIFPAAAETALRLYPVPMG